MNVDFGSVTDKIGKLGGLGVVVTSFLGGVGTYAANSPDFAQALTTFVAAAATAPFSWKGALIAGGAAVAAKVLKNSPPPQP